MRLIPHRIEDARATADITYAELARRIARRDPYHLGTVSGGLIRKWSDGTHRMRYETETIAAIAHELDVPFEFFYEQTPEPVPVGANDDEDDDPSAVSVQIDLPSALADMLVELAEGVQRARKTREQA